MHAHTSWKYYLYICMCMYVHTWEWRGFPAFSSSYPISFVLESISTTDRASCRIFLYRYVTLHRSQKLCWIRPPCLWSDSCFFGLSFLPCHVCAYICVYYPNFCSSFIFKSGTLESNGIILKPGFTKFTFHDPNAKALKTISYLIERQS